MRAIKSLDYFRKTDQKHKTRTGGIVSILSVTVSPIIRSNALSDHCILDVHANRWLLKASDKEGYFCRGWHWRRCWDKDDDWRGLPALSLLV